MTGTEAVQKQIQKCGFPKPYHAPRLIIYGPLRDLTAGGTGDKSELGKGGKVSDKLDRQRI